MTRNSSAVELARAFMAAVSAKDIDALDRMFTEDTAQDVPFNEAGQIDWPSLRRADGKPAVMEYWRIAFAKIEKIGFHLESILEVEGGEAAFAELVGDNVMADGKPYRNRYVMRFDVRDGKIWRVREYYNPVISARAFGRPIAI
ncbi:MAG: nuclear transport factor 2 family protein [Hyphomonadaceae bacterium]